MSNLYVVRHGQDKDNASGILNGHRDRSLTNKGRNEARQCANSLMNVCIDAIISSPLRRAIETSQIIDAALASPSNVIINDLLIERDFGSLEGTLKVNIQNNSSDIVQSCGTTYFLSGPGVEEYPSVYRRAKQFLDWVKDNHPEKALLVVSHGDTGKMIRAVRLGIPWRKGLDFSFHNADIIRV